MIKFSPIGFILPFSAISAPAPISNVRRRLAHKVRKYRLILPRRRGQPLHAGMALTAEANMTEGCASGMGA
jgi:hypothetical protein